MKRIAWALFVLASSGCFNFDERLAQCRDDAGAWICGDAGVSDAGAHDAGGSDAGGNDAGPSFALPDRAGLVCQQGWCWEHPRPGGVEIKTVWGKSRDDFWVGGERGMLAHWDGTTWTGHAVARDLIVKTICGHDDDVFVGMGNFGSGSSTERLLAYRAGAWTNLSSMVDQVPSLVCGSRLLVAHWNGATAFDWATLTPTVIHTAVQDEICSAMIETGPNECLFSCYEAAGPVFTRIRRCDGTIEFEYADGGPHDSRIEALWIDPTRGPLAGVGGSAEVLQRDGGWTPVFTGTQTQSMFAGAAYGNRSIAVGSYGHVLDFSPTSVALSQFQAEDNGYLRAVWVPDGGAPIAAGEWGCLIERDGGSWERRNECDLNILDLSFGERLLALTDRGVSERGPSGWRRVLSLPGARLGLRELTDGGLLTLTDSAFALSYVGADGGVTGRLLPLGVTDATAFELFDTSRAVVVRESGALLEVTIATNELKTTLDGGAIGRPVVDARGEVWVRAVDGGVFVSPGGTSWSHQDVNDGAVLDDLSVGPNRVWALGGKAVSFRPLGAVTWNTFTVARPFSRIVPLSEDQVLLIGGSNEDDLDAMVVDTRAIETPITVPPARLTGPFYSRGGEAWLVGYNGGLLRFSAP